MTGYDATVADRKRHLTNAQIDVAILWLENNEGDEAEDCQAVADWLKVELNQRVVRGAARSYGISVSLARKALQKNAEG